MHFGLVNSNGFATRAEVCRLNLDVIQTKRYLLESDHFPNLPILFNGPKFKNHENLTHTRAESGRHIYAHVGDIGNFLWYPLLGRRLLLGPADGTQPPLG